MTPGTNVRITGKGISHNRTGVTTETASFWVERGWSRVELDPKPGYPSWQIFPDDELEVIAASERPGCGQGELFGGAP